MDRLLSENEVLVSRLKGIRVLDGETAIKYGVTGPVLRAAGVPYDLRRADPYSIYDRFDFDVAMRPNGDMFDNYIIRIDEIRQSLRILEQAVRQIPAGPINSQKPQYQVRVPAGESYGRIESPRVSWPSMLFRTASPIPGATTCGLRPLSTSRPSSRCASAPRSQTSWRCSACSTSSWVSWIDKVSGARCQVSGLLTHLTPDT